jgi:hypothetical protein
MDPMRSMLMLLFLVFAVASAAANRACADEKANALARTAHCRTAANSPADVLPFSTVRRRIGDDIVRAVLCQDGQVWIYRVTTVAATGVVRTLLFDARTGALVKP